MRELLIRYLRQKIGLIFHGIGRRGKIQLAVLLFYRGIVPGGCLVKILAPPLLKESEFDYFVAHHVRMWRQPLLNGAQSISHDMIPVFLMKRHYLQRELIFVGDQCTHLYIFIGRAISLVVIHTDTYIEKGEVVPFLIKLVYYYGAVNAS